MAKEKNGIKVLTDKVKYMTTIALFLENITFGCAFNFFSPVLVDLKNKYETDIESVSRIFIIWTIAYLVGAMAGGLLYTLIRRQLGVILSFIGISLTLFITPFCPTLLHLLINICFLGFCCGAYDTAQTVWIMEMWQSKSGPFVQAQHFFFALGTNLPSLIVGPFLAHRDDIIANDPGAIHDKHHEYHNILQIPFIIIAGLAMCNALIEVFLITCFPYVKPPREISPALGQTISDKVKVQDVESNSAEIKPTNSDKWYRIKLIALAGLFLGFYQGMEMCSIQFIPTLAQYGDLKFSEAQGAYVLTGLTGAYALGRALGILIILKVSSQAMLCANLILVIIGNSILLLWANSSVTLLWVGCIVLGFGFSTIYASFCAFMERHLIFTDFVGSLMLVSGSIVAIVYPIFVGKFIEQNSVVLTYTNFLSAGLCTAVFLLAYFLIRSKLHR